MANACIASGAANLAAAALFTASSSELLAPASLMQTADVEEQWVGLGGSGDWLRADLLSAQAFDTIAIMGLAAATMRLRVSTSDPEAGDLFDSNNVGPIAVDQIHLQHLKLFGAAQTARYVQWDLALTGGVAAGKAFIGTRTQFTRNFQYGWAARYVDPSIRERVSGGQLKIFPKSGWRALDVTFPALKRDQRYGIVETIDRECGARNDVLFVLDPESDELARDFIWGPVTDLTQSVGASPDTFTKQYQFEQRR
jgi:hypothetical protein